LRRLTPRRRHATPPRVSTPPPTSTSIPPVPPAVPPPPPPRHIRLHRPPPHRVQPTHPFATTHALYSIPARFIIRHSPALAVAPTPTPTTPSAYNARHPPPAAPHLHRHLPLDAPRLSRRGLGHLRFFAPSSRTPCCLSPTHSAPLSCTPSLVPPSRS
jgi:hypothetical protein